MSTKEQQAGLTEVELELRNAISEGIRRHGFTVAIGAAVMVIAPLVAQIDKQSPGAGALAAWLRTFSAVYDAAYYAEDLMVKSQGDA